MVALSSEIRKLESSLDELNSLNRVQRNLQDVINAFRRNYEDTDPSQDNTDSQTDNAFSELLRNLLTNSTKSFEQLEALLQPQRTRDPGSIHRCSKRVSKC